MGLDYHSVLDVHDRAFACLSDTLVGRLIDLLSVLVTWYGLGLVFPRLSHLFVICVLYLTG